MGNSQTNRQDENSSPPKIKMLGHIETLQPRRFQIIITNLSILPDECWIIIQNFIPAPKQIVFTYVCKLWYNLYWNTRTGWQFDPDNNRTFFKRVNDEWIAHLLDKCNKKFFTWMCLNYCYKSVTSIGFQHIYTMDKLVSLDLSNNFYLSNTALSQISKLTELQSLNLSGCLMLQRSGIDHISTLSTLRSLALRELLITDIIPVCSLPSLEHLDLSDCEKLVHFCGFSDHTLLLNLTTLTHLHFQPKSNFYWDLFLPKLKYFTNLQKISISLECLLTSNYHDFEWIKTEPLPNLIDLTVFSNKHYHYCYPKEFIAAHPTLKTIDFSNMWNYNSKVPCLPGVNVIPPKKYM